MSQYTLLCPHQVRQLHGPLPAGHRDRLLPGQTLFLDIHCNQSFFLPHQVRSLYGPLLATVTASKSAFQAMVKQHEPGNNAEAFVAAIRARPEGKEGQVYR